MLVIRAFVRLRESVAGSREFARRLDELERRVGTHDAAIRRVLGTLRELAALPDPPPRRRIGFL